MVKDKEPVSCSPWGHKESDMTERLNNNLVDCQFHDLRHPSKFENAQVFYIKQGSIFFYNFQTSSHPSLIISRLDM